MQSAMQMRRAPRAGGAGPLAEVEDARGALSAAAGGALPGGAAVQLGCMYSVEADQLWLAAGSAAGAAAIFPVAEPGAGGRACAFGAPAAALQGRAHRRAPSGTGSAWTVGGPAPARRRAPARGRARWLTRAACRAAPERAAPCLRSAAGEHAPSSGGGRCRWPSTCSCARTLPGVTLRPRAAGVAGGAGRALAGHERGAVLHGRRGRARVPVGRGGGCRAARRRAPRQEAPRAGEAAEGGLARGQDCVLALGPGGPSAMPELEAVSLPGFVQSPAQGCAASAPSLGMHECSWQMLCPGAARIDARCTWAGVEWRMGSLSGTLQMFCGYASPLGRNIGKDARRGPPRPQRAACHVQK